MVDGSQTLVDNFVEIFSDELEYFRVRLIAFDKVKYASYH